MPIAPLEGRQANGSATTLPDRGIMMEGREPVGRPKVVIAEVIADSAIDALAASYEVDVAIDADRDELIARLSDAAALVVRSATQVDADMIAAAPKLEVIGRAGIGVDNIDVDAATDRGILVVNAPEANTISAAEHTMALLLAQARRIPEADASLRAGRWDRSRLQGVELHGKTLGVLGLGRIGAMVAERAAAFGMRIMAHDPYVSDEHAARFGVELTSLDELLAEADFLTIHMPRTAETEGLIDAAAFKKMKDGVRIVNAARGGIVDEGALAAAVAEGTVAGAAVDVYAVEPTTESPLFELSEVVVTPHLGASTREAQDKAGAAVADSVAAALRGELVLTGVNLDFGATVSEEMVPFLTLTERLGAIFVHEAQGLPPTLTIRCEGRLHELPVRPLALAALKGALGVVSEGPVSYVNAPVLARHHGVTVTEASSPNAEGYQIVIRLTGSVDGVPRSVGGTWMETRGPLLLEVDGCELEAPLTEHLLLTRVADVPGAIEEVVAYVGEAKPNVQDVTVGRHPGDGVAIVVMSLDRGLTTDEIDALLAGDVVQSVRSVALD